MIVLFFWSGFSFRSFPQLQVKTLEVRINRVQNYQLHDSKNKDKLEVSNRESFFSDFIVWLLDALPTVLV